MKSKFTLKLELSETGLNMFFKPYQQKALSILWDHPNGLSSRQVWEMTNKEISGSISRASIINFLNDVSEYEILDYRVEHGKGGERRYYWHKYDRNGFSKYLKDIIQKALGTLKDPI
jgi:hypothetical protein